ncbi:MAG: S41 family peptidase [Lachnospiraceae bacterium]|nr:S41 family peptidase [Lachnospiraceae bacterium]
MKKGFIAGFLTALLCCAILLGVVSCGKENPEESRLTKISSTPTVDVSQNGTPTPTATPAANINDVDYDTKIKKIAELLDEYYYQPIDFNEVVDGVYHGMVSAIGDPYTVYFNEKELSSFQESTSGSFAGIGSSVRMNDNGYPQLTKIFKGSPAEKAGLLPDDILVEVDGEDIYGIALDIVVTKIRGPIGSKVMLTIYREGEPDYLHIEVTRDQVSIPTVEYQMLEGNIGYIIVTEFDDVTAKQFDDAVDMLTKQNMKALIVDLRNNPGGTLRTVTSMLSRILPKGELLVYMEDKYKQKEEYFSSSTATVNVPIAVLMNGNSASASEVFAGCLQDYGKAILVGTQSFGKGIVQTLVPLGDGSAIKVTISSYFTPNGRNIHKTGLTPDVPVELDESLRKKSTIPIEEDNQLKAAIDAVKAKITD